MRLQSGHVALFLDALRFYKDDIYVICTFLDIPGDVFVSDVYYHGNRLRQYLLKYNRQIDASFENILRSNETMIIGIN